MTDRKDNDVVQCQDNSPDTQSGSDKPKSKSGSQLSVPADKQTSPSNAETDSHNTSVKTDDSGALDTSPAPTGVGSTGASGKSEVSSTAIASSTNGPGHSAGTGQALVTSTNLPASALSGVSIFMGDDGNAYIVITDNKNVYILRIGSRQANNVLRRLAQQAGTHLKTNALRDLNDEITAHAELSGDTRDVWYRVALFKDGIEIDVGDNIHTRIRVTPGKVETIEAGSETLFYRTPTMQSFVKPDEKGELNLLNKYVNLQPTGVLLLKAWLGYTLAHAKAPSANFVILALLGDQGSGKTFLCKIIQALVDPSIVGVQTFPRTEKDLVIAAQNAHALFYDNMRSIKPMMADKLCTAATGGSLTSRQLYTDADQQVHRLHVAIVLNGIHSFIDQPDLAQRCLPLHLISIDEKDRRSESELIREFEADLPVIFRGLLDLIADVMAHLSSVEVTNPERMVDFVHWLAAMEKVDDLPAGVYQMQYSEALKEVMLDSLLENPLAAAVMSFISESSKGDWSGTPTELLHELNFLVGNKSRYSQDWPQNPIALSKRLGPLLTALRRQGINVTLGRAKERKITITNLEAY